MTMAVHHVELSGVSRLAAPVVPLVVIDGQARDEVFVDRLHIHGPVDHRTAELRLDRTTSGLSRSTQNQAADLIGRSVELLLPARLTGGNHRLSRLFRGRVASIKRQLGQRTDSLRLMATDDASLQLEQSDRSMPGAESQTVGDLIQQLASDCSIDLETTLMPPESMLRPIDVKASTLSPGRAIEAVCEACFAMARRKWDGGASPPLRFRLHPLERGRPVRLSLDNLRDPGGAVTRLQQSYAPIRPMRLTALASGPIVESTFSLVPGWNPAGEGLADSEYARSTSSDFGSVHNVFRYWALNEDGAFSSAPYNQGDPYDLTTLFDQPEAIDPQPLRFRAALCQTPEGVSLGVFTEISTDGGSNWYGYSGRVDVVNDRAAIYLADDQLPGAFLGAAQAGQARVRVTACLKSPAPMTAVRWIGNGLVGPFESQLIDTGDQFAWRRVAQTSQFHAQVCAGDCAADVRDDRAALAGWLAERALPGRIARGNAVIQLAAVHCGMRLGDRLDRVAGQPLAMALRDPAVNGSMQPWLQGIDHDFNAQTTDLHWAWGQR